MSLAINLNDTKYIVIALVILLAVDVELIIHNAKEHGAEMLQQYGDDDDEYEDDTDDPWEVWD